MNTYQIPLDTEAEQVLQEVMRTANLSLSEVVKTALVMLREQLRKSQELLSHEKVTGQPGQPPNWSATQQAAWERSLARMTQGYPLGGNLPKRELLHERGKDNLGY